MILRLIYIVIALIATISVAAAQSSAPVFSIAEVVPGIGAPANPSINPVPVNTDTTITFDVYGAVPDPSISGQMDPLTNIDHETFTITPGNASIVSIVYGANSYSGSSFTVSGSAIPSSINTGLSITVQYASPSASVGSETLTVSGVCTLTGGTTIPATGSATASATLTAFGMTISGPPSPVIVGEQVTYTASISPSSGLGTPTYAWTIPGTVSDRVKQFVTTSGPYTDTGGVTRTTELTGCRRSRENVSKMIA